MFFLIPVDRGTFDNFMVFSLLFLAWIKNRLEKVKWYFYSFTQWEFYCDLRNTLYKLHPVGKSVPLTFPDANFSFWRINYYVVVESRVVMFYFPCSRLLRFLVGKRIMSKKVNNCMYIVSNVLNWHICCFLNLPIFLQWKFPFTSCWQLNECGQSFST